MVGLVRRLQRVLTVASALALVLVAMGHAPAGAGVLREGAVKACYDPVQNRAPYPPPDPGQWCQPVFSALEVASLDSGARVTWKAAMTSVPWNCGPGGTIVQCAISGIRVEAYYVVLDVGVAGRSRCTAPLGSDGCVLGGLEPGRRYKVEVYADLANGNWLRVNSSVTPCCSAPAPPVGVVATPARGSLDVAWAQSPDWGGAGSLTYRVSTSPPTSGCEVVVLACRLESVPRGVPLTVTVTASNAAGESAASASALVTVPITAPEAPPMVAARYTSPGTAQVSWSAPLDDGGQPVTGYAVTSAPGGRGCATSGRRSCFVTGLTGGRAYAFTVKAVNSIGTSTASPVGVAGVLVNPASAPRDVKTSVSGGAVSVSWTQPRDIGGGRLLQFVVRAGLASCTSRRTACVISDLALGRTYAVTVVAVTTGGRSRPATGSATTVAPVGEPPSKPTQAFT